MTGPDARHVAKALMHTWRMANTWSPMVRDARGRSVALYRIDKCALEQPGGLSVEQFHRVREHLSSRSPRGVEGKPLYCVTFALTCAFLGYGAISHFGAFNEAIVLFAVAALALVFGATHRYRLPPFDRETAVEAMLRERLCASCAYDLSGQPRKEHGLTLCPECGAAWIVPPDSGALST